MSGLELWTRIAIWLLIGGSLAVFTWFVRDLLRPHRIFGSAERSDDERGG